MRVAELEAPGRFEILDLPTPEPAADELLVRVAACGVCSSELGIWSGTAGVDYPTRIGHEVSGEVVVVGSAVTSFDQGDRVAVWTTGSGYAEFVAVQEAYARSAGDVPLDQALAEPLACAVNAVELAEVRLSDHVVIIGAGFMGNLVQQLVQLRGARSVIVADTRADVLDLAGRLGATRTVNSTHESLQDVVLDATDGQGADVTFEVTGAQQPLSFIGDLTRMSGKLVLVGFHQGADRQIPLAQWNWKAFTLLNGHFRDLATIMHGMTVGMQLLTDGRITMEPLVTHRFGLDKINEAFRTAVDKPDGFVKACITL